MKNYIKTTQSFLCLVCFVFIFTGCSMLIDSAIDGVSKAMESEPKAYAGFSTKTMEGGGYKIVVKNMRRGAITSTVRVDKDSSTYDVIFFDIEISNIGQEKISAFGMNFKLITDKGNVVEPKLLLEGGFDGVPSENKSL